MVSAPGEYFPQKKLTAQSLRDIILSQDGKVEESWKYGMPVYGIHGKMFCYP